MMNTAKYNCIIVDDEEIDRLTTLSFVRKYPFFNISGVFSSAEEALEVIKQGDIQVLFLDIDMPGLNGLQFRRQMMDIPVCIFITSYADYAVESFELFTLDFLLKPIKADRFEATVARINEYMDARNKATLYEHSLGGDTVFLKDGHTFIKVQLHEILYLEALKDYTLVFTAEKKFCVLSPIGNLLKENNFRSFIRVHRSYAVQKHLIKKITTNQVLVNNVSIPIGRSYKESLEDIKF
jgi:DNA-binding LytR/AlgR family response regulator